MTTIYDTIKLQQIAARKARNAVASNLLTVIIGEFQRGAAKTDPTDAQVFKVLENMETNLKGIVDLVGPTEQTTTELEILASLLTAKPQNVGPDEVTAAVEAIVSADPAANMGIIMPQLKAKFGDRLNGKEANIIVRTVLAR